jgi:hypothetical protein
MSFEERVLRYKDFRVTLCYNEDGTVDGLFFEHNDENVRTDRMVIKSQSVPEAPEKIYELLRECEIVW